MSDCVQPHRRQPTRLRHPWDSPGKNTGVGCHFLLQCMKVKSESEIAQLCPTLCDPMDCSLPGSSAHGIFQARVLEWGAIAFSGGANLGFLKIFMPIFHWGNISLIDRAPSLGFTIPGDVCLLHLLCTGRNTDTWSLLSKLILMIQGIFNFLGLAFPHSKFLKIALDNFLKAFLCLKLFFYDIKKMITLNVCSLLGNGCFLLSRGHQNTILFWAWM